MHNSTLFLFGVCDGPWNFVELLKIGGNVLGKCNFPLRPTLEVPS